MSQDKVRYNANPKIDFSNPPSGDRVVTWISSSAEFGLSRNEINQPIYVYEFFEDNQSIFRGYEDNDPTAEPTGGDFRALPNSQPAGSNYNIEYYSGLSNDNVSISAADQTELDYLTRGANNDQMVLFMYNYQYPQHFVCFNAQLVNPTILTYGRYDDVFYLDYMQNPGPQTFFFGVQDNNGGNFFRSISDSSDQYYIIAMSPDIDNNGDGDKGLIYINVENSQATRTHDYIILTAKPSGSNQDISNYLRCFEGGRLQIVDVTNTDNNLIYKFDESFAIYNNGTAGNRYVAFRGCKLLSSNGSFGTPGQKHAVSVYPNVNEFKGLADTAGNYFSGPTPTVVREVFLENQGDKSFVGRRFEWGDKEGGDYWSSTYDANEFLSGQYQIKSFYRFGNAAYRFTREGIYSLNSEGSLVQSGNLIPGTQGSIMAGLASLPILVGHGPYLEIEFPSGQSGLPNADIRCQVYWNFSPKEIGTTP